MPNKTLRDRERSQQNHVRWQAKVVGFNASYYKLKDLKKRVSLKSKFTFVLAMLIKTLHQHNFEPAVTMMNQGGCL